MSTALLETGGVTIVLDLFPGGKGGLKDAGGGPGPGAGSCSSPSYSL